MSETRFPPSGTKCVDCKCCQATVYAGNDPLCWECDEGKPCRGTKRPIVDESVLVERVPAVATEPLPNLRAKYDRDEPQPKPESLPTEEKSMSRGFAGPRPGAVPCAAEGCTNNAYPPKKYCTSKHFYNNAHPPAEGKVARVKTTTSAPAAKKRVVVRSKKHAIVHHVTIEAPITVPGCSVAITGEITAAGADKFWSILSIEQKRQIVVASIQSILTAGKES